MVANNEGAAVLERMPMAKKVGRPKTSNRKDVTVKIEESLADKARMVAVARKISLAEFLSDVCRTPIEREYSKEIQRLANKDAQG